MRKSMFWSSVAMCAALLAVTTIGCGFFGSKKSAEVAQVEEDASPSASPGAADDGAEEDAVTEDSEPQQPNAGSSGEASQPPASEQSGGARTRGPRMASGGLGGSSSTAASSQSGGNQKSRPRGPRMASGGLGGNSSNASGSASSGDEPSDGGGASASADGLGEGDEPGAGGEGARGGGGDDPYSAGGYEAGGEEGPPKGEGGDDPYASGGYSAGGEEGPPKGEGGDDPYADGGYSAGGEEGPPGGEGGDDPYADFGGAGAAPGLGGPGGGGLGPAGAGRRPGAASGSAKSKPKSKGLLGKAEQAMAEGREKDAFQYLYALALSDDKSELFDKIQWVGGLRRPTLAVRWAIGVDLDISPRSYKGSLYPIGSTQQLPSRNSGRRGGGGENYGAGGFPGAGGGFPGGPGTPGRGGATGGGQSQQLADYAGELGTAVVEVLAERVENGSFGKVLAELSEFVNASSAGSVPGAGGFAGGGRGPAGFGGGGLAGGFDEGAEDPGAFGGEGLEDPEGAGGGDLGVPDLGGGAGNAAPGLGGGRPPAGRGGGRGPARNDGGRSAGQGNARSGRASNEPPQLAAGVVYIGTGNAQTLRRKASELGVDVVLIFHVDVSHSSRTGLVKTSTKATVTDVRKDSVIMRMKSLSNIKVQSEREDGDDPVNDWVKEFESNLDDAATGLVVSDLPAGLKPEHAKGRVEYLVAQHSGNPLPVLTEISFYFSRGLIDDELRTQAYQQILGKVAGEQLSLGDAKERAAVLEKWLPKE